jgi:hypothetical protein
MTGIKTGNRRMPAIITQRSSNPTLLLTQRIYKSTDSKQYGWHKSSRLTPVFQQLIPFRLPLRGDAGNITGQKHFYLGYFKL